MAPTCRHYWCLCARAAELADMELLGAAVELWRDDSIRVQCRSVGQSLRGPAEQKP
jgi:hypothetical protein